MAEAEVEKNQILSGSFLGSVKSRALGKWWRFRYSGHIGGGSIFSWGFCGLNSAIDTFFDETSFQRFKSKFMAYQSYTLVSTVYHQSTFCQILEKIKNAMSKFLSEIMLEKFMNRSQNAEPPSFIHFLVGCGIVLTSLRLQVRAQWVSIIFL